MANQEFEHAVAAATADASASRKELGCSYAAEFREDPETFNSRKLAMLGREGLVSFVTTVSMPTRGVDPANVPEVEIAETTSADLGWGDKQNVPLPFELSALLFGAVAGVAIVFGSAIALTF
jgi:hypothetical protein